MRALRAAGLTLAGAERLTQTRGGSTLALSVLGGLGIVVLAGVGVLSMNLPAPETDTVGSELTAAPMVVAADEPVEDTADATDVAALDVVATTSTDSATDLPWLTALEDTPAPVDVVAAPVEIEQDCVVQLAADVSGVLMQFDAGSAQVPPPSYDHLFKIGTQVNACPQARVLVAGHSDSSGSDLANLQLSWTRAENTVDVLSALGIDTRQFETVGFGSRAPLQQGSDGDDGINRRVELRVSKGETE
ncbi:OmpA family protein [Tateyamaria sp. ANG-S1]|uniref:OmpA family protein n=1 Tax=Tateyamaria sp. ANG-S1 TaxID=1577905 RepID=UPI00187BD4A9|nr:OmpA family protein [Tateyamaria sp. ANG-S1]